MLCGQLKSSRSYLMTEQNEEKLSKGQKTARQILEAAARCIRKVGVEKTSVTNIANEAGLKRSLIAYHFPKKSEIFHKVILHIITEVVALRSNNTEGFHSRERLQKLMKTYFDFFYENAHYFNCFIHFHYLASIDESYRLINDKMVTNATEQIASCLNELLVEKEIAAHHSFIEDFSETIYQGLLGSVMRFYTTSNFRQSNVFREKFSAVLEKEIDLFLYLVQNH